MIVSQDDAASMWCPFARIKPPKGSVAGAYNREFYEEHEEREPVPIDPEDTPGAQCTGPACMAWRTTDYREPPRIEGFKDYRTLIAWGYCGLAGKPPAEA